MANLIYKGLKENLPAERNANSFYLTTDTRELYFGANLYTEAVRFYTASEDTPKPEKPAVGVLYIDTVSYNGYVWNGSDWATVITGTIGIDAQIDAKINALDVTDTPVANQFVTAVSETDGKVSISRRELVADDIPELAQSKITNLESDLAAKVDAVTAGNDGIEMGGTATEPTVKLKLSAKAGNSLTIETAEGEEGLYYKTPAAVVYGMVKDEDSGDYAAVYHLTADGVNTGTAINIPKDMVVESGSVVTNPDGHDAGTYIKLVLANADEDELFINVGDLIEYVTSGSMVGDMIVVNVSEDHKVTATITDGTITLAKLHSDVQAEINKAHVHDNKDELDKFEDGDKAKLDAAYEAITVGTF